MDVVSKGSPRIEAHFCYQLHIGGFGLSSTWDWKLPVVQVDLSPSELLIPSIARKFVGLPVFATSWNAKYKEIDRSEVIVTPGWPFLSPSHHQVPFGVRLHMTDPLRSRILLFTNQFEDLLTGLNSHGVQVDPAPHKLNFILIGRK
jgi:hypothetical protein